LCLSRRLSAQSAGVDEDAHPLTRRCAIPSLALARARSWLRVVGLMLRLALDRTLAGADVGRPSQAFLQKQRRATKPAPRRSCVVVLMISLAVCLLAGRTALAQSAAGEIELAAARPDDPITISADQANEWQQGAYDVLLLRGRCVVGQGYNICRSNDAVLWIKKGDGSEKNPTKVIAYLEGDVQIDAGRRPDKRLAAFPASNDRGWLGRFRSTAPVRINTPRPSPEPSVKPAFFQNALDHRNPSEAITRTQYVPSNRGTPPSPAHVPPPPGTTQQTSNATNNATGGLRHLRIFPRGESPPHIVWERNGQTEEGVAVITNGVQIFIDGPQGQLDIVADKIVIWTVGEVSAQVRAKYQDETVPLEVYLEGNVVFRQGDRVIYADRMYYDVKYKNGTVLQAEITSPAPKFGGLMRLKADLVRQVDDDTFFARHSYFTSSRMGKPRFRVQSSEVKVYDRQRAQVNPFTGSPIIDPITQQQVIDHDQMVTGTNNTFFLGPAPVFWWPRFTTTLQQPSTVLQSVMFQDDKIFGFWAEGRLNAFQLLGMRRPPRGVNWDIRLSELTKRGYGVGTDLLLNRQDLFGVQGPVTGMIQAWGLRDGGLDQLGNTRMNDPHPDTYRGRILGQFRQTIPDANGSLVEGYQISAELGLISDYNFLESFYEAEFETHKDETTDIDIKKITENREWTVYGQVRVNPFFTQTNWLPRLDHYMMGQSLANDRLTWFEHSNAGYAQFLRTQAPTFSAEEMQNFNYLPWETTGNHQGDRIVSGHEIDAPLQLGPVKLVPYALGQVAQWGQDLKGQDVGRAFGQVGARSSILFWAANPNIESDLFNIHGLAHKVTFDVDAFASGTNIPFTDLALYDSIDDDALNRWRRRFMSIDYAAMPGAFGGTLPAKFDPRFYAFRSGLQSYVSSPVAEVAGNLQAVQLGMTQRWQTKRGPVGNRRIIDVAVLNAGATYFPNPNRDNFGANWGLVNYDFQWHVGDRFTVSSDAGLDFFYQGMKTWSVGASLNKPPRINLYAGIRSFAGPFTYNTVTLTQSYQLSPKYLATASTSFALNNKGNIGENFTFTRVGEAFVTSLAFYVDGFKNNNGVNLMIAPRFLGQQMLRSIGGASGIPLPGTYGLE
jgi:lipopolysaccharide export system protein LptA